jgi:hypothetical protein
MDRIQSLELMHALCESLAALNTNEDKLMLFGAITFLVVRKLIIPVPSRHTDSWDPLLESHRHRDPSNHYFPTVAATQTLSELIQEDKVAGARSSVERAGRGSQAS